MTAATIAIGFLLALAIGLLLGHRMGVQDGIREMQDYILDQSAEVRE